jgi:dienelactone hydrolase
MATVTINPWGACRSEKDGEPAQFDGLLSAARISSDDWVAELALPLAALDAGLVPEAGALRLRATRIRARRPLAPEFRWVSPLMDRVPFVAQAAVDPLPFDPPALGNTDAPLQVGRVSRLPPVIAEWDHPEWRDVAAFELPRNDPHWGAPRHSTRVKWMHDGRTLALLLRMTEPEPVVARAGGRDSAILADDHVAVYLATSGSAFLEIAVNSAGAVRDARGQGPRSMNLQTGWNVGVEVQTDIRHGHWIARINVPLDECANALGEPAIPAAWRVLLARQRAARPGEAAEASALPPVGTFTFHGPIRYRPMRLDSLPPATSAAPSPAVPPGAETATVGKLRALQTVVWTPLHRSYQQVRTMVQRQQLRRVESVIWSERQAWFNVQSREDWERFRAPRFQSFVTSLGDFPPARPSLDARVSGRYQGDGYRLENLIYQSRPGYYVTANLYLPTRSAPPSAAMIIVHSQHYPKTQGELHDMGELWARTGCAVLIIERPGYGERAETSAAYRQAYASRHTFTKQLYLVGESYSAWAAWDILRAVDYLHARSDIDHGRIVLLGSVAGGGEPSALAAAMDPRITAVVPFNYDQGHVRVHGDSPGQIAGQFSPWFLAASIAPRKFVRAFEFGWEGAEEADHPTLWIDGMSRSQMVWGFFGARENLAAAQAYGLIRLSMERVSHCFSIGPQQRRDLYPIFQRWFGIPHPSQRDLAILPDSELSTNPQREEARRQEAMRRRPHAELMSIPPVLSTVLPRRHLHQIAHALGENQLQAARVSRRNLSAEMRRERLRQQLKPILGDIEPTVQPGVETIWRRSFDGIEAEALSLAVEDGIQVPLLLLRPAGLGRTPVVAAITHHGKSRFHESRAEEIERLVTAGIAVCLPDVRGTGETSPSSEQRDGGPRHAMAQMEFDLGKNLLGARLRDLRTVLSYLRTRDDIDGSRMAIWGESFALPNPADLLLDELESEAGPQIQHRAQPMGAHLALLAALYEEDVRAIVARGGLAGYLSLLDHSFVYVPFEEIIHGVLRVGDIADLAAAIAPRALRIERCVNGRNILLNPIALETTFLPTREAYRESHASDRQTIQVDPSDVATWLVHQLIGTSR